MVLYGLSGRTHAASAHGPFEYTRGRRAHPVLATLPDRPISDRHGRRSFGRRCYAVAFIRAERYLIDPASFLERETMHYADIDWMNKHLDPSRHRVATWFKTCGYLEIPWMTLLPNYQAEIRPEETGDPQRLYAALKRQGFTHLFGRPDDFAGLDDAQILVHSNPASRLGSTRFFREPSTEATAIFAIK